MDTKNIIYDFPFVKTSETKKPCPSPKKLVALLRSELSERKRSKVIDHLSDCSTCTQEIKFINEVLSAEKTFYKKAVQIVTKKNLASSKKGTFIKSPYIFLKL